MSPRKYPGYVGIVIGAAWKAFAALGNMEFISDVVRDVGGPVPMMLHIVLSGWFSLGLIVLGLLYVIFVGEPEAGVQRHRLWPYVGWSMVTLSAAVMAIALAYGLGTIQSQEDKKIISQVPTIITKSEFITPSYPKILMSCGKRPKPPLVNETGALSMFTVKLWEWGTDCSEKMKILAKLIKEDSEDAKNQK